MRERSERVESPGTYVTEGLTQPFLLITVFFFSDRPSVLWWLSHGERRDAVT